MLMAINVAVFIAQFLSKDRLLLWGAKVRSPLHATFIGHSSYRWIGLTCSGKKWHEQLGNIRPCSAMFHTHFCCSNLRVFMLVYVGSLVRQEHHAQESPAKQIAIGARTDNICAHKQPADEDRAVVAHLRAARPT